MQITIRLFATFREGRFIENRSSYPAGTTIAVILSELNIPLAEVGMILCNCRHAEPEQILEDDNVLAIFPHVGGG